MSRPKPVLLLILDGWGHREERDNNAIALANAPNWRRLLQSTRTHWWIRTANIRRSAGRTDGQFRSRPHEHRCRPHRVSGPDPHRCGDRGWLFLPQSGPARRVCRGEGRTRSMFSACSVRRRAQPARIISWPSSIWRRRKALYAWPCMPFSRPRHSAAERARCAGKIAGQMRRARQCAHRHAYAGVTTPWIATSAGSA